MIKKNERIPEHQMNLKNNLSHTLKIYFSFIVFCLICWTPLKTFASQGEKILINSQWLNDPHTDENLQKGLTAYIPLDDAFISIASRIYLIRHAKHQIDLQYYIWHNDFVGQLILNELLKAADRGVKIRLLIDDQNGTRLDSTFQALLQHPLFEIKVFNPYKFRKLRFVDFLFRPNQVNHRMHNKLIIADNTIAVTGGRNISSEYFDASYQFQFTDLDILFYGTAASQAEKVFQTFWDSPLSVTTQKLITKGQPNDLLQLRSKYKEIERVDTPTEDKINEAQIELNEALKQRYSVKWAKAHFVADSPKKIHGHAIGNELIYNQMFSIMGHPQKHLELVSAYFVPTQAGTQYLSKLSQQDVKIRVLTNSFAANDVAIVHAFYSQYRKELIKNGIQLYEFKPIIDRKEPTWYEKMTGRVIPAKGKKSSSLHAKFFDVDGKVFIGSFNFDPRSAYLNTEVGLVVESEDLQNEITKVLDEYLPTIAYQLKLDKNGNLVWLDHNADGQTIEYHHDPETTRFQRFMMKSVSYLPIEWMM